VLCRLVMSSSSTSSTSKTTSTDSNVRVEQLLFRAELAEQAERFDDMVQLMTQVVHHRGGSLQTHERHLLSIAFKSSIGQTRASGRVIRSILEKEHATIEHERRVLRHHARQRDANTSASTDGSIDSKQYLDSTGASAGASAIAATQTSSAAMGMRVGSGTGPGVGGTTSATAQSVRTSEVMRRIKVRMVLTQEYQRELDLSLITQCVSCVKLLHDIVIPATDPDVASSAQQLLSQANEQKMRDLNWFDQFVTAWSSEAAEKHPSFTTTAQGAQLTFYFKMLGDYYRYMSEIDVNVQPSVLSSVAAQSLAAYSIATLLSQMYLAPIDPIRLGLALNFAFFYYEIMSHPGRACELAKNAFDSAITDLDEVRDSASKEDTTLVMQLLQDYITIWSTDINDAQANLHLEDTQSKYT
jgi:alkylhydroperoxidase/carboxymuconolactone decarboxylase family protein YurZ